MLLTAWPAHVVMVLHRDGREPAARVSSPNCGIPGSSKQDADLPVRRSRSRSKHHRVKRLVFRKISRVEWDEDKAQQVCVHQRASSLVARVLAGGLMDPFVMTSS